LDNSNSDIKLLHAKREARSSVKWLGVSAILIVSLLFCGLIKLGFWQLQRADTKAETALQLSENRGYQLTVLPQGILTSSINQQRIDVSGRLLHRYTWLLDNQVKNGKVGYQVLVAAAIDGEQRLALINLGWIAAPVERIKLPVLTQWPEAMLLKGRLHIPTDNPFSLASVATQQWPKRIAQIDFSLLEQHTQHKFVKAVIRLDQDQPVGYDKHWRWSNRMTQDKHRGYAFQWFALAFTLLVLSGYFSFRLTRGLNDTSS